LLQTHAEDFSELTQLQIHTHSFHLWESKADNITVIASVSFGLWDWKTFFSHVAEWARDVPESL